MFITRRAGSHTATGTRRTLRPPIVAQCDPYPSHSATLSYNISSKEKSDDHNPPSADIESPSQSAKATRRSSCTPWMYTAFYYPSAFRHLLPTVGIAPKSTDLRNAPTENPRRIRRIPSLEPSLRRVLTRGTSPPLRSHLAPTASQPSP